MTLRRKLSRKSIRSPIRQKSTKIFGVIICRLVWNLSKSAKIPNAKEFTLIWSTRSKKNFWSKFIYTHIKKLGLNAVRVFSFKKIPRQDFFLDEDFLFFGLFEFAFQLRNFFEKFGNFFQSRLKFQPFGMRLNRKSRAEIIFRHVFTDSRPCRVNRIAADFYGL